jgi:hypothetical protein
MGTRCLTYVYEVNEPIVCLYRQFDGYPSGHGAELGDFLKGIQLGNGIAGKPEMGTFANGMGCLAAQLIAHFKKSVGGFYIHAITDSGGVDYEYHVYANKVVVKDSDEEVVFSGSQNDFVEYCKAE